MGQEGSTGKGMGIWPFARSAAARDAEAVLDAVTAASRRPWLYGPGRAPDTLEGRFELLTLFASLAMIRLRKEPQAEALAQHFTDKLFRLIDAGLREAGVGDTSVPKRMRKMAGDFYGRLEAYAGPAEAGDLPVLEAAFARNVGAEPAFASMLAGIAVATLARQAELPVAQLAHNDSWPAASP